MLEKTNVEGYLKDPDTGVVINTNEQQYTMYQAQIDRVLENQRLKERLSALTSEVDAIKAMLGIK